jgi:hypothetical protein
MSQEGTSELRIEIEEKTSQVNNGHVRQGENLMQRSS